MKNNLQKKAPDIDIIPEHLNHPSREQRRLQIDADITDTALRYGDTVPLQGKPTISERLVV
ncbi:hypothetical protein FQN57_002055 [Myotisia sp. PD_48]|nr:hypothetical protein FQN57_002055 [Myotisia sp. PD_48]